MRFSVLAEFFGGFAVSNIPQCSPSFFSDIPQCPPRSLLFKNKKVNHSIAVLISNLK